jgi:hypothetical protein
MKKQIKWQKWIDPLNSNVKDIDPSIEGEVKFNSMPQFSENDDTIYGIKPQNVMMTQFGALSLNEYNMASNQFDLWVMHTNFNVNNKIVDVLNSTQGVEAIIQLSRYKTIVGFPISGFFKPSEVMTSIKSNIMKTINSSNVAIESYLNINYETEKIKEINTLRDRLNENANYWFIYVLPDGQTFSFSYDNNKDFEAAIEDYKTYNLMLGGILITDEDYNQF